MRYVSAAMKMVETKDRILYRKFDLENYFFFFNKHFCCDNLNLILINH